MVACNYETHSDYVRAREAEVLAANVLGYRCEVVEIDGVYLLYADGYCMGEIYEEDSETDYIEQIKEILG